MVWTSFWDMHSGGQQKLDWHLIFIEGPQEDTEKVFSALFGRNPHRVTCTCCGEDYSVDESYDLKQASGYHRNCRSLITPKDPKTGLYRNNDPIIKKNLYLDDGEKPPTGYELSKRESWDTRKNILFKDFVKNPELINAKVIYKKDYPKGWKTESLSPQGYVWVD
jgi:hypothetical protein